MHQHDQLRPFYAAYGADDQNAITIVPSFDGPRIPLLQGTVGPFCAGIPVTVPLWLATSLVNKSLATMQLPAWLSVTNLARILQYEKSNAELNQELPADYYEVGQRLLSTGSGNHEAAACLLLLQDLLEGRLDKLRQQFQAVLAKMDQESVVWEYEHNDEKGSYSELLKLLRAGGSVDDDDEDEKMKKIFPPVRVPGIGTQELAVLQRLVQQTLLDRSYLLRVAGEAPKQSPSTAAAPPPPGKSGGAAQEVLEPAPRRRPLRRFR
jgi:GINS complex protein